MNKLGPVSWCALALTCRRHHQINAGCIRGEKDRVNTAPPLPPAGLDEGASQMTKLLIAGRGYYDTLMTFDTRIRWLKKWKMCHQLSEEWCSKEPNKATGLTRSQLYLWDAVFHSEHSYSLSSHTGRDCRPTAATHFKHKNTHNCKTHTHNYFY